MIFGVDRQEDGTINFGWFMFEGSGKKIMLAEDEVIEFENKLKLAKAEGKLLQQNHQRQDKDYYLLVMVGDIEADLKGPFDTTDDRDMAALQHRNSDPDGDDGLHMVDITKGAALTISDYSGGFFLSAIEPEFIDEVWWAGALESQKAFVIKERSGCSVREAWELAEAEKIADLPEPIRESLEIDNAEEHTDNNAGSVG